MLKIDFNKRLPVLFIGHGAPNILLQNDPVLNDWKMQLSNLSKVKRVLIISAHWETSKFTVGGNQNQSTIHDFSGFPKDLYEIKYSPPPDTEWASNLAKLLNIECDNQRGLDHGSWVPLTAMFPEQNIPVSQLSVAPDLGFEEHLQMGKDITKLREQGVLIIASGVIVHNLNYLNWQNINASPEHWANDFMDQIHTTIVKNDWDKLIHPLSLKNGVKALPTAEHFLPLLIAIGAAANDTAKAFCQVWRYANLSQHSYRFG